MNATPRAPGGTDASLEVLSVASEMAPLIKTGGLADVVGALPEALSRVGVRVRTLLPAYPAATAALRDACELCRWPEWFGGPARLLEARHGTLEMMLLDAPHLYAREGNPYVDSAGQDWADNAVRFAALSLAAARIGRGAVDGYLPDLIHAHDWQAALVPAYLRYLDEGEARPATVLTVHNLAFQGRFAADAFGRLGLPVDAFVADGLEYFGDVNFLKAGLLLADAITTVSPTYAREIRTPSDGMGMDAVLRWRGDAVGGIVNGIDPLVWDPERDPLLERNYGAGSLAERDVNRRAVERRFGLPPASTPLLCMVSRLTAQKGIDLVIDALDAIVGGGARLVVLGSGDKSLERALQDAATRWPAQVGIRIGYDEGLSHLMQGGCDAILIPSRFEPCGLTQLYGLRYGCVPIVARVGGLADTVVDANDAALKLGVATGIQFGDVTVDGMTDAIERAIGLHRQPAVWRRMQENGMRSDVGWGASASAYAGLYRRLVASRAP